MVRISNCISHVSDKLVSNGSMICLNWTLVILMASVQTSLMIFYSLGLIYEENDIFKQYTVVMMYVNVGCTCAAQVILSFIFSLMSEPIQVLETLGKKSNSQVWEVRRDYQTLFRQECPILVEYDGNSLKEPLAQNTINSDEKIGINQTADSEASTPRAERNLPEARVKSEELR